MLLTRSSTCGDWHENSCLDVVLVKSKVRDVKGYYSLLGVNSDASAEEVRHAAKQLLMRTHPDRGGDEESFIEAVDAYQTLCNPENRAEYDLRTFEPKASVRTGDNGFRFDFRETGEAAWYKEPTMVLSDEEVLRVRKWRDMLLEAARGFRLPLEIKAGVCRCPDGYYEKDGIALIGRNQVPEIWAAKTFILKTICEGE